MQPSSPELWERRLRTRLLARERASLAECYDQFGPLVYGLAARITGDRAAAEDIAQEVFLYVWEHPESFDPARGRFRSWVAMLAHRRAVDWVRRAERGRRHATAHLAQASQLPPPPGPEEAALARAVAKCVRAAVEELPADQQAAILLAYYQGRSFRQVAVILGIPEGTAKSRLRLGLRRIADRLAAEGLDRELGPWT